MSIPTVGETTADRLCELRKRGEITGETGEDLPPGFPLEEEGVCYFLDGYKHHPNFAGCDDTEFCATGTNITKEVT